MFGSSMIEVAIGVIFIYLSLSLVCTAANGLIASLTKWRAKTLAEGIRNLLQYDKGMEHQLYNHPLVRGLYRKGKMPSYIPSRTFAIALMDIVIPHHDPENPDRSRTLDKIRDVVGRLTDDRISKDLKEVLLVLMNETESNLIESGLDIKKTETALNKLRENIEIWFNNSMERVSGWYKRKIQVLTFGLALLFTCVLNVDTVSITRSLSNDSTLRAALVTIAEKSNRKSFPPADGNKANTGAAFKEFKKEIAELQQLGIPLGWNIPGSKPAGWGWLTKILGLLLTAGAASLGAPFWFDILNKFVSVRSTGKAPEETPKSPKEETKH